MKIGKLHIAAIVLFSLQAVSCFPALVSGTLFAGQGIPWYIGRFIFAEVGIILLIIAQIKKSKNKK